MKFPSTDRSLRGALFAAVAGAGLLAGCQSAPPPPPPPPPAPVVELLPPPEVELPERIVRTAGVFEDYVSLAANFSGEFADGAAVASALQTAAAYEPKQFQRGQTAFAAIVALQDPTFVAAVREFTTTAERRDQVIREILKDPAYVVGLSGSDRAAGLVVAALESRAAQVRATGDKVKQAAYDVQKHAWSKRTINDRDARLAKAKSVSVQAFDAKIESHARLTRAFNGQEPLVLAAASEPVPAPYTNQVARGLAVAALAVLGHGGEENAEAMWSLLEDPAQSSCLNMAKLNLYQCLAVARPYYEDVFCLGQHILLDTSQCMARGARPAGRPGGTAIAAVLSGASASEVPAISVSTAAPAVGR